MESKLPIADLARYPWSVEAKQHLSKQGFTLEEFSSDGDPVLERAAKRVEESASSPMSAAPTLASRKIGDFNVELLSFPLDVAMLRAVGDRHFQRRFAVFEAKKSSSLLKQCPAGKLAAIAQSNFKWKVAAGGDGTVKLHFADYLRNAVKIQGDHWKLVNRHLADGEVHLTMEDAARLMEEEIVRHIEATLQSEDKVDLPGAIRKRAEELKRSLEAFRPKPENVENLGKVTPAAFPPCITKLHSQLQTGGRLPHLGRFTLTAFLLIVGADIEAVVGLFMKASDFDENLTRYMVSHIAGEVGGKTQYRPLNCNSMRTHSLCVSDCKGLDYLRSPLQYYKQHKLAS